MCSATVFNNTQLHQEEPIECHRGHRPCRNSGHTGLKVKLTGGPLAPWGPCGPGGPASPWNTESHIISHSTEKLEARSGGTQVRQVTQEANKLPEASRRPSQVCPAGKRPPRGARADALAAGFGVHLLGPLPPAAQEAPPWRRAGPCCGRQSEPGARWVHSALRGQGSGDARPPPPGCQTGGWPRSYPVSRRTRHTMDISTKRVGSRRERAEACVPPPAPGPAGGLNPAALRPRGHLSPLL